MLRKSVLWIRPFTLWINKRKIGDAVDKFYDSIFKCILWKISTGFPQYAHPLYARFVRVFHNVHSDTTTTGLFFHN